MPQVPDPKHTYSFDIATDLGGSAEANPITSRDLFNAFLTDHWHGVWQYDEFNHKIVAVNPPLRLDAQRMGVTAADINNIGLWLAAHHMKCNDKVIAATIKSAASACRVHPVRQYLASLPVLTAAEGAAYFTGIASRLWGAESAACGVESDHLRRFAIAAVRRVKVPGTKVDTMLVFSGAQGTFKSRFGEKLFDPWFTDQMPALTSKDASIQLHGHWGIEMAEMQAMRSVTQEDRKAFLSRCTDKYRPPYGEGFIIEFPRQSVFYGTTNHVQILSDETGDRRYDVCRVNRAITLDFERDEFWAAAVALESAGASHYELADPKSAAEHKAQFQQEDAWDQKITEWAAKQSVGKGGPGYVRAVDVLTVVCQIAVGQQDDKQLQRVRKVLRRVCGPAEVRWTGQTAQSVYPVRDPVRDPLVAAV